MKISKSAILHNKVKLSWKKKKMFSQCFTNCFYLLSGGWWQLQVGWQCSSAAQDGQELSARTWEPSNKYSNFIEILQSAFSLPLQIKIQPLKNRCDICHCLYCYCTTFASGVNFFQKTIYFLTGLAQNHYVSSLNYFCFFSKTAEIFLFISFLTKECPNYRFNALVSAWTLLGCEWTMSQIAHFYGVEIFGLKIRWCRIFYNYHVCCIIKK